MMDFGENYYRLKRSALIASSIIFVLSLPGVAAEKLAFFGVDIKGVSFDVLLFFLFCVSVYYFVNYIVSWWIEVGGNLLAIEGQQSSIIRMISDATLSLTRSIGDLEININSAKSEIPSGTSHRHPQNILNHEEISSAASALISSIVKEAECLTDSPSMPIERILDASTVRFERITKSNLDLPSNKSLRLSIVSAITDDIRVIVETSSSSAMERYCVDIIERLRSYESEYNSARKALDSHSSNLIKTAKDSQKILSDINRKLFSLKTARRVKFVILDMAIVVVVFLLASSHYVGRFIHLFPSAIPG